MRNNFVAILGAATLAAGFSLNALQASAASSPSPSHSWSVTIAGRPIDAQGEYAIYRKGVVSVDLVDFSRALGGTLIYRTPSAAEIAVNNKHLVFTTGNKTAQLDSVPVALGSAPFVEGLRYYVPLRSLASLAGFAVHYDRSLEQISLGLPVVTASPTPLVSQLVMAAAGSTAADGLHLTVTIANLSGAPLDVAFPTSARVAFVAIRDGRTLWESLHDTRQLQSKGALMFSGNEAKSFAGFWPGYLTAGPGPITIRTELLSTPTLFAPNFVVVGRPLPSPTATPTGAVSPKPSAEPESTPSAIPSAAPTVAPSATPSASASPKASAGASHRPHHFL